MIDTVNASERDKARFLRVFAFIGAVTSLLMSVTSYQDGYIALSYLLIVGVVIFALPFLIKGRDQFISVLMLPSVPPSSSQTLIFLSVCRH